MADCKRHVEVAAHTNLPPLNEGEGGKWWPSKYTKVFSLLSLQHLLLAPLVPCERQKPQFKYNAPTTEGEVTM